MLENLIAASPERSDGDGAGLRLVSLAPKFSSIRHQLYLDLLERALAHEDSRNIALTGAYGTGKSSVLERLQSEDKYQARVVPLSLSTISAPVEGERDDPGNSRVNQIQKEIVKQLLYRTAPKDVPQSRYQRATVPRKATERWLAVGLGLAVGGLVIVLGLLHPFISTTFSELWRQVIAYVGFVALSVLVSWVVIVIVRSRPLMSASVNAAITTVTLTKQTDTYFDAYLDEIVYFFEANQRDIVVIEDIDRFEDAEVFDTLRALNGLLNNSGQIGRRIVFIYAIRDSVFERIGDVTDVGALDEKTALESDYAKEALKRASRTKFFDVIIPIVPFISPDNARDVMSQAMKSSDFKISGALIRLAARHVADMRMIHNIRNEFEVYRNQLVISNKKLPDITDDLVFAIVLFKNTHLGDYEKIRHRDSSLDRLYEVWRSFTASRLRAVLSSLAQERVTQTVDVSASARAERLKFKLLQLKDDLGNAAPAGASMTLDEDIESALDSPSTWEQIVSEDELVLTLTRSNGTVTSFNLDRKTLERLLGESIDPNAWRDMDTSEVLERIRGLEDEVKFVRHHTWAELCARSDVQVDLDLLGLTPAERARMDGVRSRAVGSGQRQDSNQVSFGEVMTALLPSEFAREMVRHGYLTAHFALYASRYYGKHLSEQAREYIYRCVGPGDPDMTFSLSRRDVRQILREQDADKSDAADLFNDPSILNIDVFDYLLVERPGAAATAARQLSRFGPGRREFLDAYLEQGAYPAELLALVAPDWDGVFEYAATFEPLALGVRVRAFNAALAAVAPRNYETSARVRDLLEAQYASMEAVTSPGSEQAATAVLAVFKSSGANIADLSPLNDDARAVAIRLRLFPITEGNMRQLMPGGRITLAAVRKKAPLFAHVLENLEDYLALAEAKPGAFGVADDEAGLTAALKDLRGVSQNLVERLLATCPTGVRVDDLSKIPVGTWPPVVGSRRTLATFANVSSYVERYEVDSALALLLKQRRIISTPASLDDRRSLAYVLLAARDVMPSTLARVQTASTLHPSPLDPAAIEPESGDLVARLIKAKLLPDDETVFTPRLLMDWPTLEKVIKVSNAFKHVVSPTVLPAAWVPSFLRSRTPTSEERLAVVQLLETYLATAKLAEVRAIGSALADGGWRLRTTRILALIAARAFDADVMQLVSNSVAKMPTEELVQLLRALDRPYARVAEGGSGRPNFPSDDQHRRVLERMVGITVRRIEEKHFKILGRRLVAHLM